MPRFPFPVLLLLILSASPLPSHQLHTDAFTFSPLSPPSSPPLLSSGHWSPHSPSASARSAATVSLLFALHLRDPSALEALLRSVSDPSSPRFGRYATVAQLADLAAPHPRESGRVLSWLGDRCGGSARLLPSRDMVSVRCRLPEAEELLGAPFRAFRHAATGRVAYRAASSLSGVPAHLHDTIAFVGGANTPLHHGRHAPRVSDDRRRGTTTASTTDGGPLTLLDASAGLGTVTVRFSLGCEPATGPGWPCNADGIAVRLDWPGGGSDTTTLTRDDSGGLECEFNSSSCSVTVGRGLVPLYTPVTATLSSDAAGAATVTSRVLYCKEDVTPQFLSRLYGVPPGERAAGMSGRLGIAEFLGEYFSQEDLDQYCEAMGVPRALISDVVGPNNETRPGGEATLDVDIVAGMAPGARLVFWSQGGTNEYNDEEPFLLWLQDVAAADDTPVVWSISYGDETKKLPDAYTARIDQEFMKLGARGVSVLVSSGDDGSGGYYGHRNESARAAACARSGPEYPATSAYVTACGATQLSRQSTPSCADRPCALAGEVVCSAATDGVITSGGSTSWRTPRPSWQERAVSAHLDTYAARLPPDSFWNRGGRAVPDWTAYGNNFLVVKDGDYALYSGTSASTPLLASMVALWNARLEARGLPRLGFLNPAIYDLYERRPDAFRDVVVGDTRCFVHGTECCRNGFEATPGYDMASGVGSPRFEAVWELLLERAGGGAGGRAAGGGGTDETANRAVGISALAVVLSAVAVLLTVFALKRGRRDAEEAANNARVGNSRLLDEPSDL